MSAPVPFPALDRAFAEAVATLPEARLRMLLRDVAAALQELKPRAVVVENIAHHFAEAGLCVGLDEPAQESTLAGFAWIAACCGDSTALAWLVCWTRTGGAPAPAALVAQHELYLDAHAPESAAAVREVCRAHCVQPGEVLGPGGVERDGETF